MEWKSLKLDGVTCMRRNPAGHSINQADDSLFRSPFGILRHVSDHRKMRLRPAMSSDVGPSQAIPRPLTLQGDGVGVVSVLIAIRTAHGSPAASVLH